jgi:acyl carrier protein
MVTVQQLQSIFSEVFVNYSPEFWQFDTRLLGEVPEFDSMAIVTLIGQIEEDFGIFVEDDELNAEVFESFGSVFNYVSEKLTYK